MRFFLILSCFSLLLIAGTCKEKKESGKKLKGRLEIAALCMNYTIAVIDGQPAAGTVASDWTDETTGKQYKNVFRLGNPCDFPPGIKQGDEFYFQVDSTAGKQCAVCMAYYPTPTEKLSIKVVD